MNRIVLAFRAFFALLFTGALPADMLPPPPPPPPPPKPEVKPEDGALQLLGMLQRDARLLDLVMDDISSAEDEQIGLAAREVLANSREVLTRYFALAPVIDAVEGSPMNQADSDPGLVKYVGNVPATGKPKGGVLRHRGWKATVVTLPKLNSRQDLAVLAPAEIEVE